LGLIIGVRSFLYRQGRVFLIVAGLGILWTLLSACTHQEIPSDSSETLETYVGSSVSQGRPEGGSLTFLWADITTLDPHLVQDSRSAQIVLEIFSGLVAYGKDMTIVPELALSWEISGDGTQYTFLLQDGITFHDGRALTANDVKLSIERATDPALQSPTAATYLDDIVGVREKILGHEPYVAGVDVIGEQAIKFTLDEPKPYFLGKMTNPVAAIVDTSQSESSKPLQVLNGTGPFMVDEWLQHESMRLMGNDNYINDGPFIDEVVYVFDGDGMGMYENNEIDIMELSAGRVKTMRDDNSPLQEEMVVGQPAFQVAYIGVNVMAPPFDNSDLRRALFYAVDKEHIAAEIRDSSVVPAYRILPPGFPAHSENTVGLTYDLELAKEFLLASGYSGSIVGNNELVMTLPGTTGIPPETFRFITKTWEKELGVKVKIQQTEWGVYLQDLNDKSLQMFGGLSWNADYVDPHNFLDTLFHSASSMNHSSYQNTDLDKVLEFARIEQDSEVRLALYQQAEDIILQDIPIIPLWFPLEGGFLVKPRVQGYFAPPIPMQILKHVWIQK